MLRSTWIADVGRQDVTHGIRHCVHVTTISQKDQVNVCTWKSNCGAFLEKFLLCWNFKIDVTIDRKIVRLYKYKYWCSFCGQLFLKKSKVDWQHNAQLCGLSIDQLRWIYSKSTKIQLCASGWDPTSIPFDAYNETSHKWSEISDLCPKGEMKLSDSSTLSSR